MSTVRRAIAHKRFTFGLALSLAGMLLASHTAGVLAYSYDGTDPYSTGCSYSSYVAETTYDNTGWEIDLRYGPGCGTAYARAICHNPWYTWGCDALLFLKVERINDGAEEYAQIGSAPYGTTSYTAQLYDDGSFQSVACLSNVTWPGWTSDLGPSAPTWAWRVCTSPY